MLDARLFAATGGDDYALLVALDPETDPLRLSLPNGTTIVRIGTLPLKGRFSLSSAAEARSRYRSV